MNSLPDLLRSGLVVLSIGLNPSLPSVEHGFYFANPRNRFWRAARGADLIPQSMHAGLAAQDYLFERGVGFTDLVKRATAMGGELRAADYRAAVPEFLTKLDQYAPEIAWFHGMVAYRQFLKVTGREPSVLNWGRQELMLGTTQIFVSPNPSPANAAFSLEKIIESYRELKYLAEI